MRNGWRLLGGGAAAIMLAVLLWLALPESSHEISCASVSPALTIAAFGDSLVAGEGATTPGGFVTLLSERSGVYIRNHGRSGDTTAAARTRLPQVLQGEPDIVLVLLGGNDALRRTPIETTSQNLEAIVTELQEEGAEVILLGVLGGLPINDPYRNMFEELASKRQVVYVPDILSGLIGRSEYMDDSVHPNEAGYARIAERVQPFLEEACAQSAP